MGDTTRIEWCDATWSPWEGCTKIAAGCENCYAAGRNSRFHHGENWGPGAPRRPAADWKKPYALDRKARRLGVNLRVFPSICDPFDGEVPAELFWKFAAVVRGTPHLTWLLLTKRYGRAESVFPNVFGGLKNVHLGVSVANQGDADATRESFHRTLAPVKFVSYEPALGPINWAGWEFVHQIIDGGESGAHARPPHPDWFLRTRDFCVENGIAYLHKQNGEWASYTHGGNVRADEILKHKHVTVDMDGRILNDGDDDRKASLMVRVGKKAAGRLLFGREWNEFPAPLASLTTDAKEAV